MTNKEIQLIIKQAVKEAREETKQEIYQQIKNITDIDPDFKRIGKMKIYAASAHKK